MIAALIALINERLPAAAADGPPPFSGEEAIAALLTAPETLDVSLLHDRPLEPAEKDILIACLQPTTQGARTRALASDSLYHALGHILTDKLFKERLRARALERDQIKAANAAISSAGDLELGVSAVIARFQPRREAGIEEIRRRRTETRTPTITTTVQIAPLRTTAVQPAPALPEPPATAVERPAELLRFVDRTFEFRVGRHRLPETTSVGKLVDALVVGGEPARVRAMLLGLAQSDDRLLLLVIERLDGSASLAVAPAMRPLLRLAAIRLMAQFNAHACVHEKAAALASDGQAMATLEPSDRLNVNLQIARAALRSGRTVEAAERFRDIFLAHPERGDAIMNYVSANFLANPEVALEVGHAALINHVHLPQSDLIFLADVFINAGRYADATTALMAAAKAEPGYAEALVGFANLACARGDRVGWLSALRRYGDALGFPLSGEIRADTPLPFALIAPERPVMEDHPLVAVVMTSFNSVDTLRAAAASVLAQTAGNLELWIVDDGSEDGSREIILELAAADRRVRPLFNDQNGGTYVSKNRAIALTGALFVTFHDSDDWMHPYRIERQLRAMEERTVCVTANWLRMRNDGYILVRRCYTHLNPASTFVRREAFEELGGFDRVRTGADAEFLARLRARYGWSRVKVLPDCLGIGLHHDASLTQAGVAAFDQHRYSPVRLAYTEAWLEWHVGELAAGGEYSIGNKRPFPVPEAIRVAASEES